MCRSDVSVDRTAVESECLWVNKNMCEEPREKKKKKRQHFSMHWINDVKKKKEHLSEMHLSSLARYRNEPLLNAFICRQLNTCVLFIHLFLPFNKDRMKPQSVSAVI